MKKTVCILWLLCTVLASAIAQQTPTTAQIMSKASEYWAKQDYTQAASWYRKAAERGDATAQNCLGNCYFSGKGVDQSDMYALAWYQRAAAQDNPDGMVNLGYCYYIGKGIAQDYDTAMSWLQKAKVLYTRARKKGADVQKELDRINAMSKKPTFAQNESPIPASFVTGEAPVTPASPVVKIIPPEGFPYFSETQLEIRYSVDTPPDNPVKEVKVTVNGEIQPTARVVKKGRSVTVTLPKDDSSISISARNNTGWSETEFLRLKWDKSKENLIRPNLYVLAIGINDYDQIHPPLKMAVKDMNDFVRAVEKKKHAPYENIYVTKLSDKEATRQKIEDELCQLAARAESTDFTFIFFAGHGLKDNKDRFYLAPVDANIEMIRSSCIDADRFSGYLDDIRGKVVVFADACYSGALLQGRRSVSSLDMQKVVSEMNRAKPGRYIYASSEDDTVSNELPEWKNGAFTKALIEAFEGKAKAEGQKALTTVELMNFLRKRMKEIIKGDNNRKLGKVTTTGYRGEEENQQFIQAMCACLQVSGNETLQEVFVQKDPSQKSNYLLTFELVSHQDGSVLKPDGSNLKNPYYVRATNHSLVTLFVNVLNIDSSLNTYLVLQPDKQGHFANYLLPAESTVSFPQQTIEFSRMSTENFVLMAAPFPIDFSLLESPIHRQSEESKSKMKIGLSRLTFH